MRYALLVSWLSFVLCAQAARQPNFVFVLIDDMGWGDFSCFGNKEAKTPNIDRLAAEGLRFSQFYVNSPICSPSLSPPCTWRVGSPADQPRSGA